MSSILNPDDRLRFPAAAQVCEVNVSTLHRWRVHGLRGHKLPSYLIGGKRYVLRDDLEQFIAFLNEPETNLPRTEGTTATANDAM